MLPGFEDFTAELTAVEIERVVPRIAGMIRRRKQAEKAITNTEIRYQLKKNYGIRVRSTRVRAIIHYIRVKHIVPCIAATSKGYYVETRGEYLERYISSLNGRVNSISEIVTAIRQDMHGIQTNLELV